MLWPMLHTERLAQAHHHHHRRSGYHRPCSLARPTPFQGESLRRERVANAIQSHGQHPLSQSYT